ncbi:aromatic ring-hydroxylating dioxygenase subunit alpha [Paraburkholderia tropica]|uniref:aromatic ring-hydroxylating dioxygenase subunit alpha n=1 Tax=Paraburkholderia tropica TaxID=92647 RepID=UPI002AAFE458|nr:aromatic ring-hydroxylating dioxygenase subunit alpha [Paraburkholderia tropica]
MYPLTEEQPFPHRQWWLLAYSSDVGRKPLGRTLLGERVVLYRTADGQPVVLSGICPHRMYPMEEGCLVGDAIQCGYHGITYGTDGRCVQVPSQAEAAPVALRRYPVVEVGETIWVWTGEPDRADISLMPPLAELGMGAPGWKAVPTRYIHLKARYTFLLDNLLDLSHISYIHATTIPGASFVASIPAEPVESATTFNLRRTGRDIPGNPFLQMLFPEHAGAADQDFDAEYFGPCLVRTGGHYLASGTDRRLGTMHFLHFMTPETAHSTHYHVVVTRDFRLDDAAIDQWSLDSGREIGPQDQEALAKIERVVQVAGALPREISVRADVGSIQVRRRLSAQIRAEKAVQETLA